MNQAIILDPAHGKDTLGKRSPDGKHREYLWSRERIANIVNNVLKSPCKCDVFYPFLYHQNEPGLTTRVKKYNDIAKDYDETLVISLHNDAEHPDKCGKDGWGEANGTAIWTSKGQDKSDSYATNWFNYFKPRYPHQHFRKSTWQDGDPDYEADFTILAGNKNIKPKYHAVLIEWLFQTNKGDVDKLMNPTHNKYFEDIMTQWIINLEL